jgi:hypothetical protein
MEAAMNAVVQARNYFDLVVEPEGQIRELLDTFPGWSKDYAPETRIELMQAARLMRQTVPLIASAHAREKLREEQGLHG